MSSTILFCFLALLLPSANAQRLAVAPDPSCMQTHDGLEVGYRFTPDASLYSGKCLDTSVYRSITGLTLTPTQARFANYMHQNSFWNASLALANDTVESVLFHVERFDTVRGVSAAHIQVRFVLKKGVLKLSRNGATLEHDDLLISFEAGRPVQTPFNIFLGAFDSFALIPRVMSTMQKLSSGENRFEQFEIELSPEQRLELLRAALRRSQDLGVTIFYNTLRPNCTTEALDLIDGLPGLRGRAKPFLTVLGPDPVAGPALLALRERGVLGRRIQDFNDEVKGVRAVLPMPKVESSGGAVFPRVEGKPWSLVMVAPPDLDLGPAASAALKHLGSGIYRTLPDLAQVYASALMLGDEREATKAVVTRSVQLVLAKMPELIREVDRDLPARAMRVHAYLVPFDETGREVDLTPFGVPAALAWPVRSLRVSEQDRRSRENYFAVGEGAHSAAKAGVSGSGFGFLSGAALTLDLARGRSKVITQVLAAVEPASLPIDVANSQVKLTKMTVPTSKRDGRTLALITHTQNVQQTEVSPVIQLDFGAWGGLGAELSPFGLGTFQLINGACNSTPYLSGRLAGKATNIRGVDALLENDPVRFDFLRLLVNMKERTVSDDIDVRVTLGSLLKCVELGQVEAQFSRNLTEKFQRALVDANFADQLDRLSPLF